MTWSFRFVFPLLIPALFVQPLLQPRVQGSVLPPAAVAQTPAPVAPQASADPAWEAAMALKKKAAWAEAAAAFEAWAKQNPTDARVGEALNEAGVCTFSVGRSQLKLTRNNTPESLATFARALGFFEQVVKGGSKTHGGRAQYMRGWTKFNMDDFDGAEAEFSLVLEKWATDAKYVAKALERRSMVRRARTQTAAAKADLERYVKEFPQGDEIASVKRYLQYGAMFDKPAPALNPEVWVQGQPTTLKALAGEVVVLYFLATWCDNCEAIRPAILDLVQHYEPMGVRFIGVFDKSKGQTLDAIKAFLPLKGYAFPVMMDGTSRTTLSYMGTKLPDMVLIDRAGRVRWHDNPANLRDATIEALLVDEGAKAPAK